MLAIPLVLWYGVLLPGGATLENTTQGPVRLLLYPTRVFRAEAGSGRMPPDTDQSTGEAGTAAGTANYGCTESDGGGTLHRQLYLWI